MSRTPTTSFARLAALLLAFSIMGCNEFAPTGNADRGDKREVMVTVLAVGPNYLDADDGIRYEVTSRTKYEGYTLLSDISAGDMVEIEFRRISGSSNRRALEIEAPGANEVYVTVLAVGPDYLDADDAIRYEVTAATKYEGYTDLSSVIVGDRVEIEFEEIANSSNRRALEIEAPGSD